MFGIKWHQFNPQMIVKVQIFSRIWQMNGHNTGSAKNNEATKFDIERGGSKIFNSSFKSSFLAIYCTFIHKNSWNRFKNIIMS